MAAAPTAGILYIICVSKHIARLRGNGGDAPRRAFLACSLRSSGYDYEPEERMRMYIRFDML